MQSTHKQSCDHQWEETWRNLIALDKPNCSSLQLGGSQLASLCCSQSVMSERRSQSFRRSQCSTKDGDCANCCTFQQLTQRRWSAQMSRRWIILSSLSRPLLRTNRRFHPLPWCYHVSCRSFLSATPSIIRWRHCTKLLALPRLHRKEVLSKGRLED